jgi:hypothetical protein
LSRNCTPAAAADHRRDDRIERRALDRHDRREQVQGRAQQADYA